jgi:hypothetical protein
VGEGYRTDMIQSRTQIRRLALAPPGEKATDVNGNKWVCGPEGQWFRDYWSLIVKTSLCTQTAVISSTHVVK